MMNTKTLEERKRYR